MTETISDTVTGRIGRLLRYHTRRALGVIFHDAR